MLDFRKIKNEIKKSVEEVNQAANWKWTVTANKAEIRLRNDYIKGDYDPNYFSITSPEPDLLVGIDCLGQKFGARIIGDEWYQDGSLAECADQMIRSAEHFFSNCY